MAGGDAGGDALLGVHLTTKRDHYSLVRACVGVEGGEGCVRGGGA